MEPKKLQDITRKEWIKYRWEEIPASFGDPDRMFIAASLRTPDESYQAMMEWDETAEDRDAEVKVHEE